MNSVQPTGYEHSAARPTYRGDVNTNTSNQDQFDRDQYLQDQRANNPDTRNLTDEQILRQRDLQIQNDNSVREQQNDLRQQNRDLRQDQRQMNREINQNLNDANRNVNRNLNEANRQIERNVNPVERNIPAIPNVPVAPVP